MNRAISSYSSSVRTLIQGQRNAAKLPTSPLAGKSVLVGVQELYHALDEIDTLEKLCAEMNFIVQKSETIPATSSFCSDRLRNLSIHRPREDRFRPNQELFEDDGLSRYSAESV